MSIIGELVKSGAGSVFRLFPSYLICFIPFLFFGTANDLNLILWKIAVVGTGLLVFHYVRKSMFPYIDLRKSIEEVKAAPGESKLPLAILTLSQSIIVAAMAVSVLCAVAGGM
jgi:hypothetical protein